MRTFIQKQQPLVYLVQKGFRQIFRNPDLLRMIFAIPVIQLLIFAYATTTDLSNIRLGILDEDHSSDSRRLTESFFQNDIFKPASPLLSESELQDKLFRGKLDIAVWIPKGYASDLSSGRTAEVSITVDGQNSSSAARALGYSQGVIRTEIQRQFEKIRDANPEIEKKLHQVTPVVRYFYNPTLESRYYMVPAIIVMLITLISVLVTGLAVVREKEIGTLEQLLVTPLTGGQIVAGMTIPFALLAILEFTIAFAVAIFWFKVPMLGSVWVLYFCAGIFMLTTMGGGLLVSTVSNTQQQAMFTTWFFLIFFIMTSGFFYPVENMPPWIYALSYINPMRYFMTIIRGIFLRGATLYDVLPNLIPLFVMGVSVFTLAVVRFRKRLA
jgi:ABC-2 type transport system permease protein